LLSGTLDVALRIEYDATLLVGFRPMAVDQQAPGVSFQQVIVRVEDASDKIVWGPFTVQVSGFVDRAPDGGVMYGITDTVLLGAQLGSEIAQQVANTGIIRHFTSIVRVLGSTVGGPLVESQEWTFPIDACFGCLVTFPTEASDPCVSVQPNCELPAPTGSSIVTPCRVGQDDPVDCRVCKEFLPSSSVCEPIFH
jgi:hypothetical protein